MFLLIIVALFICVWLLKQAFNSRTALRLSLGLTVSMSFLMTFTSLGFASGVVITAVAGLVIILLDDAGILA